MIIYSNGGWQSTGIGNDGIVIADDSIIARRIRDGETFSVLNGEITFLKDVVLEPIVLEQEILEPEISKFDSLIKKNGNDKPKRESRRESKRGRPKGRKPRK